MALAKPRILSLPFSVLFRGRQSAIRCHSWKLHDLGVEEFAERAGKVGIGSCAVARDTVPWTSTGGERFYCNAAAGPRSSERSSRSVTTDGETLLPVESVETGLSPFLAPTRILKRLLDGSDIWADVETWIVFSDLHLSRRTSVTCLQVLRTVHSEASARNAGIIFLGDFWHARGALPVELLNMAIAELQTWTCPTIFIPGNHDQVTVGGEVHALTVLEAANYYIKVISEPTVYLEALWLPFRRNQDAIKDAVMSHSGTKAIFAHLDVIGAYMNEARQASDGIDPSLFPSHLPVFTGHYHKPHVVDGTQVEYIGSPYQVSASESGQEKRLLILDHHWQKVGDIPIDIGPHHYVFDDESLSAEVIKGLQSGDLVRWRLPTETLSTCGKKLLAKLRRDGVHIDLIFPSIAPKQRIEGAEDLDAFGLFKLYAHSVNMSDGASKVALDMLHSLNLPANVIQRPQVHLVLESVELEGFGPFLEPVKYPLAQRGVRVVSGRNMDSLGADSNGAGKTTLVMAPLWALTGSTDPRPDSARGLTASDVVHHKSKRARVQVEGSVNGKPFMVERSTGSRKSTLRFVLDGEDQTCQEIKLTQERIDEFLNTTLLQRVVFHGQHGVGGLLESNEKSFKEELSKIVIMDIWLHAKERSTKELRDMRDEVEHIEGALGQLSLQRKQLSDKVLLSCQRVQDWERALEARASRAQSELQAAHAEVMKALSECRMVFDIVEGSLKEWERFGSNLEQYVDPDLGSVRGSSDKGRIQYLEAREQLVRRYAELNLEVRNAKVAREAQRSMLGDLRTNFTEAVCERCLQPISADHVAEHLSRLEEELTCSLQREKRFTDAREKAANTLKSLTETREEEDAKLAKLRVRDKERSGKLLARANKIWEVVASAQVSVNEARGLVAGQFTANKVDCLQEGIDTLPGAGAVLDDSVEAKAEQFKKLLGDLDSKVSRGRKCITRVEFAKQAADMVGQERNPYRAEYDTLADLHDTVTKELQRQLTGLEKTKEQAQWLKEVDTAFGHSGIQSYVLEGALAELQERADGYARAFSGGSLGLLLQPTKERKSSKGVVESIDKVAVVRLADGSLEHRAMRQLSGGERRRQALALALGYAELAADRGGLHCDLLVLDEVLQHLDGEGKSRVISALRGLPQGTILLVSQAHSDIAQGFHLVDVVVKQGDCASVHLAEDA